MLKRAGVLYAKLRPRRLGEAGFTLIELIITATVVAIGFVAVLQVITSTTILTHQSRSITSANAIAQFELNYFRSFGYAGLSTGNTDLTANMPTVLGGTTSTCSNTSAKWMCVLIIKGLITNVHTDSGWDSAIAIGTDGMPVIAYDSSTAVSVRHCEDPSCVGGGGTSTVVNTAAHAVGNGLSMAIGSDGFPVISHYVTNTTDLAVTHCGNVYCNNGNLTNPAVDPTGTNTGYDSSIAIGADGLPIISYTSDAKIRVTKCDDLRCSSGTSTQIDTGDYSSIAVPSDGLPVISYRAFSGSTLKVAKCSNASCTSSGATAAVPNVDVYHTSIKIGSDGFPVISFIDATTFDLLLLACTNSTCSLGSLETLDDDVSYLQGTSLDIGTDGLPVVAYRSRTTDDTMLVKCGDSTCTQVNVRTIIDATSGSSSGRFASVSTAAGAPVISYLNRSDQTLRVAKCASISCDQNTASITVVMKYLEGSVTKSLMLTTQVSRDGTIQ